MGTDRPAPVVLVIEDEWLLRDEVAKELKAAGWDVLEASSGEGALALFEAHRVDVVFTDIQLAGYISGWEVAERVRAARPEVPIAYASANSVDSTRRVAGSLFFNKPYDPEDVVKACRQVCEL